MQKLGKRPPGRFFYVYFHNVRSPNTHANSRTPDTHANSRTPDTHANSRTPDTHANRTMDTHNKLNMSQKVSPEVDTHRKPDKP